MRISELDDVEHRALCASQESPTVSLKRKLETLIDQSEEINHDPYTKGFIAGLKYALSLITQ